MANTRNNSSLTNIFAGYTIDNSVPITTSANGATTILALDANNNAVRITVDLLDSLISDGPSGGTSSAGVVDWQSGQVYQDNQLVIYQGTIYLVTADHTSSGAAPPATDNSNTLYQTLVSGGPQGPQGPQGPAGPAGPAGTGAEIDASQLSATERVNLVVNSVGSYAVPGSPAYFIVENTGTRTVYAGPETAPVGIAANAIAPGQIKIYSSGSIPNPIYYGGNLSTGELSLRFTAYDKLPIEFLQNKTSDPYVLKAVFSQTSKSWDDNAHGRWGQPTQYIHADTGSTSPLPPYVRFRESRDMYINLGLKPRLLMIVGNESNLNEFEVFIRNLLGGDPADTNDIGIGFDVTIRDDGAGKQPNDETNYAAALIMSSSGIGTAMQPFGSTAMPVAFFDPALAWYAGMTSSNQGGNFVSANVIDLQNTSLQPTRELSLSGSQTLAPSAYDIPYLLDTAISGATEILGNITGNTTQVAWARIASGVAADTSAGGPATTPDRRVFLPAYDDGGQVWNQTAIDIFLASLWWCIGYDL